jgi:hypothetical protein
VGADALAAAVFLSPAETVFAWLSCESPDLGTDDEEDEDEEEGAFAAVNVTEVARVLSDLLSDLC